MSAHWPGCPRPAKRRSPEYGISEYRKLLGEIRQNAAAVVVSDQLEISIIADSALQAKFTSSPDELPRTLLIAFNIAEGIFDTQRVSTRISMRLMTHSRPTVHRRCSNNCPSIGAPPRQ